MKVAAIVFTILGMIANFFYGGWILGLIGLGVGIWALVSLGEGKKNTACGVLSILFTGLIGGILYLCWDGN